MLETAQQRAMVFLSFTGPMESQRDWVVSELEQMFKQYGNFVQKSSVEIESQLNDKARNAEEYMTLARRLLRHMLDVARQRSSAEPEIPPKRPPFRQDSGPNPFRVRAVTSDRPVGVPPPLFKPPPLESSPVLLSQSTSVVFPAPLANSAINQLTMDVNEQASPQVTSVRPRAVRSDLVYEAVHLPAPNKRTFVSPTTGPNRKPLPEQRLENSSDRSTEDTEILTRLLTSDLTGDGDNMGQETYEASYKFLVPRNSVIKQITIHVKNVH